MTLNTATPRTPLGAAQPAAQPAAVEAPASEPAAPPGIRPADVLDTLRRHMLIDGYPIVVDLDRSHGSWLVDAATGKQYLDLFMFFASAPIGFNHPRMLEPRVIARLARTALMKPSNSDFYTVEMAEFVDTFEKIAMPPELPHLFLVSGGTLGVENALKAAFDWKVRKNFARGYRTERGTKILHFEQAFHGRSGYTLSLTNTADPRKTKFFPKFDWPRVVNPKIAFPLEGKNLEAAVQAEKLAVAQMERAFLEHRDDIAAIIIEPIQGEGGDNHFRPEFFRELRRLANENEALLIFDEVQTGVGLTGAMWAYQHFGVSPDILCFGKKMQICGMLASKRLDEIPDNVFVESSRINSTWGGSLVDMVRATEYLNIIREERLVESAAVKGRRFLDGLVSMQKEFPNLVANARGRGLMCAFDLPEATARDRLLEATFARDLLIVPTGPIGVRFRPSLALTDAELDEGLKRLRDALESVRYSRRTPQSPPPTK
jgi:L-lysine 6-transaminase